MTFPLNTLHEKEKRQKNSLMTAYVKDNIHCVSNHFCGEYSQNKCN